ncbi:MAG: EAL domain-containing protein [Deinococcales bacterium]|nr:EAL domain-containing protein [Deinococcales bacterium]
MSSLTTEARSALPPATGAGEPRPALAPSSALRSAGTESVVEATSRLFAHDCFCLTDLRLVGHPVVHASPALADLTGYAVEALTGRNLGFLLRNDTDQEAAEAARSAVESGRPVTVLVRAYREDGALFWCEQRHYPIQDGEGRTTHLLTLLRDVSDQVHAASAQAVGQELSGSLEGDGRFFSYALLLHDDGRAELAWASEAWRHLTGYGVDDVVEQGLERFVHSEDRELLGERLSGLRHQERRVDQYRLVTQGGRVLWVEDFATRRWRSDEAGVTAVYGMMKDVTNAKREAAELWRLAHVDALTGLPNAHLLEDRVQQALLQARRNGTHVALALLDLDHFRFVERTFSQRHGERLIIEVARRLRRALRRTDTLARCGTDTFALVLCDLPNERSALPVLEKALAAVRERYQDGTLTLQLSATLGVDILPAGTRSPSAALERADEALRRAKANARGGFRFYDAKLDAGMRSRLELEGELRRALSEDQLVLHYQPRVQLDDGAIHSVEALVRWGHPVKGLLKPADFVPLVEEAQLGPRLFEWVLERACRQAQRWQKQRAPKRVAVNVSPTALASGELVRQVQDTLSRYDLHPGLLELEISERTGHETLEAAAGTLQEVRAMGVHVALDDFGIAHSSLTQLRGLPLDGLKIDRSFISQLDGDGRAEEVDLLRAIIALGKSLKLRVTAEGIETKEQNLLLRQLRCDDGQGFLFSHPVPAEYVPAFA